MISQSWYRRCWSQASISSSVSSAVLGFPVVGPHLQGRRLRVTALPKGSFLESSRKESAAQCEEVPPDNALSVSKDPASAQDCRKKATKVLQEIQALVVSEAQSWKKRCGSCTTLEQAGVSRAEVGMELEKSVLQEYEKLQTQVESSFQGIRVKTEGKLLAPHEQQIADLLDKNRELENRLKEKDEREGLLDDQLATMKKDLEGKEAKITALEKELGVVVKSDKLAFGAIAWNKYFGDVGKEPPLSPSIVEAMESPCPFWTGKRIRDTHLLVMIPSTVNGQPFSLDLLETLIQNPKTGGNKSRYGVYNDDVKNQIGSKCVERSYWILITRELFPFSTSKTYDEQKALIAACTRLRTGMNYKHPSALEAATAVLTNFMRTGERLIVGDVWARCKERIDHDKRAEVGHFDEDTTGIKIDCWCGGGAHITTGVLACCTWNEY